MTRTTNPTGRDDSEPLARRITTGRPRRRARRCGGQIQAQRRWNRRASGRAPRRWRPWRRGSGRRGARHGRSASDGCRSADPRGTAWARSRVARRPRCREDGPPTDSRHQHLSQSEAFLTLFRASVRRANKEQPRCRDGPAAARQQPAAARFARGSGPPHASLAGGSRTGAGGDRAALAAAARAGHANSLPMASSGGACSHASEARCRPAPPQPKVHCDVSDVARNGAGGGDRASAAWWHAHDAGDPRGRRSQDFRQRRPISATGGLAPGRSRRLLYRAAREALDRRDYRRAADLFARDARPSTPLGLRRRRLYWRAFSLYRLGGTSQLREGASGARHATRTLPSGGHQAVTRRRSSRRIQGELARQGDPTAAAIVDCGRGERPCHRPPMPPVGRSTRRADATRLRRRRPRRRGRSVTARTTRTTPSSPRSTRCMQMDDARARPILQRVSRAAMPARSASAGRRSS